MVLNSIKRFARDKRGNFAIMTVFTFPMLVAGVAMAVDISENLRLKTDLQNANDTAVLFATRSFQETKNVPSKAQVEAYINGNLKGASAANVNIDFDKKTNIMTLTSESTSKPILMNYFGNQNTKVQVLSKAKLGVSGILEFSMALDTTWSMNDDDKMKDLKVAAKDFVKLLFDKKDQGADVRGAIVPFANYVNVGVSRRNEPWMNVPADIDTRETKTRKVNDWSTERNCKWRTVVINHPAKAGSCWFEDGFQKCWSGSAAWTETKNEKYDCQYDKKDETYTTGELVQWNGCVSSRPYPDNVVDAFGGKKFPGVIGIGCTAELQPLTAIRGQLVSKIESLRPGGDTYIPDGVMWGMRTLTNAAPFSEANAPDPNGSPMRKALIIMTDGQNSIQPYLDWRTPSRSGNSMLHDPLWIESPPRSGKWIPTAPNADPYTLEACNAAKAAGLEVYTISFGDAVPNSVKILLASCASKPEFFTHAADSVGLSQAFNDIADELLAVRLTQ